MENNSKNGKIEELQNLEQTLQSFLMQKQNYQIELNEINNALEELNSSSGEVYKILSGVMIKSDKEKVKSDLTEKKKIVELRIKSLDGQEDLFSKKIDELRKEITSQI